MTSLASLFPLEVRRIMFEPLEKQHVPEYITVRLDSVGRVLRRRVERSALGVLISLALMRLGLRGWLGYVEATSLHWLEQRVLPLETVREHLAEVLVSVIGLATRGLEAGA